MPNFFFIVLEFASVCTSSVQSLHEFKFDMLVLCLSETFCLEVLLRMTGIEMEGRLEFRSWYLDLGSGRVKAVLVICEGSIRW